MKVKGCKIIKHASVTGLSDSIRGAKFPLAIDTEKCTGELTPGIRSLAMTKQGEGHDNWLNGIIVRFDLNYTVKAWTEAERYNFFKFVSSQSTMHRIIKFDLDKAYISYVDPRIIDIIKEKVALYNVLVSDPKPNTKELERLYLEILYSNPCGFKLTAQIVTNYRQLKTIYLQRRKHRLPEWQWFCDWIETLPYSEFITLKNTEE